MNVDDVRVDHLEPLGVFEVRAAFQPHAVWSEDAPEARILGEVRSGEAEKMTQEPKNYPLVMTNIAMENGAFIDDFPIKTILNPYL